MTFEALFAVCALGAILAAFLCISAALIACAVGYIITRWS